MIITRHGKSFLKFSFGDKTIAINPISKNSKEKTSKFGSDIAISTVFHPDFNGFEQVSYNGKEPFIVKGAGEYEISDIFIKGYGLNEKFDGNEEMITSYTLLLDNIDLAIFGPISSGDKFSNEAFEEFAKAEIFFIPISGGEVFSPKEAAKFVKQFLPKVIVPIMNYSKDDLEEFAGELGTEIEKIDKLTIKAKDLNDDSKIRLIELKIV